MPPAEDDDGQDAEQRHDREASPIDRHVRQQMLSRHVNGQGNGMHESAETGAG